MNVFKFDIDGNSVIYYDLMGVITSKIISSSRNDWSIELVNEMSESILSNEHFEVHFFGSISSDVEARKIIHSVIDNYDGIDTDGSLVRLQSPNSVRVYNSSQYIEEKKTVTQIYNEYDCITSISSIDGSYIVSCFDTKLREYKPIESMSHYAELLSGKKTLHLGLIDIFDIEADEDPIQVSHVYLDMILGELFEI